MTDYRKSKAGGVSPLAGLIAAAERGSVDAMYDLGVAYEHGLDTEPDAMLAVYWHGRAAKLGCVPSQLDLGLLYLELGEDSLATQWLAEAAANGNEDAVFFLEMKDRRKQNRKGI